MNLLRKELEEKSGKIKELNKATAELEKNCKIFSLISTKYEEEVGRGLV